MLRISDSVFIFVFMLLLHKVYVLENGIALTPPMGWMSWGYYMCSISCEDSDKCLNEELILQVADTFYNEGYQEAGYEYIIIDDCWSEKKRDSDGRLVPDRKRFPRGMKFLADYIHSKGLKFGMYTNIASVTCMQFPGSRDHFEIDAKTFADWGIDYLKVDGCFVEEKFLNEAYILLGKALHKTGRPIVYSCSWPYYIDFIHHKKPNLEEVSHYCHMWRNYHDVSNSWIAIHSIITYYKNSYKDFAPYHGPGNWNDPDMLIFGTGALSHSQSRIHLAVYAMLSAPLLLSCDMTKITDYEKKLLLNLDLIAIAQDTFGIMAKPYELHSGVDVWVKPHNPMKGDQYPSYSFAFVNMEQIFDESVTFSPRVYGLNSTEYTVYDVFNGIYIRNISLSDSMNILVPGYDVILYTLYPL